ncbi:MAG: glycosyltransferase, partial [Paludibacteraceae bacterium]|nr:glycosyltransferase [Paludibacteraceae bacterium]
MAKISIIIPFYNAAKHIDRCVKSILSQTYRDF